MHNGVVATFSTSPTLKRRMLSEMSDKAAANVLGSTDSEHLAGLYFTYLGDDWERTYDLQEMKRALEKAISTVIRFQKEELSHKDGTNATVLVEPSSLNLCTTDGTQLLAFRYRNSPLEEEQPPSLYYSTVAGPTLNRKYEGHPDRVSAKSDVHPEEHEHAHSKETTAPPHIRAMHLAAKNLEGSKSKDKHGRHVIVASEPTTFDQSEWELIPKNSCVLVAADMTVAVEPILDIVV